MKLLTRLALGGFDGSSLFRCRRPIGLRSIHSAPSCGQPRESSDSPAATAAVKDPWWVLLNCEDCRRDETLVADAKTMAESRTSTGQNLRVSFSLAAPPASSYLHYDCKGSEPGDLRLVVAHGDSVVFMMMRRPRRSRLAMYKYDHFVYRSGGAARPPSLSLLPARDIPKQYEEFCTDPWDPGCRVLLRDDTGLLRRGEDDLLVVQLEVGSEFRGRPGIADLCMLRFGSRQWELRSVPIVHDEGDNGSEPLSWWDPNMTINVGDRFMCWVQDHSGFLVCDMADEASPKLRYVPMPASPHDYDVDRRLYSDDLPPLSNSRNLGAAGADAVRYVRVDSRCCCGGPGRSSCARSRFAFTVTMWTMTLRMEEPMAWVKEGVLDCEELWALPGYEGLPRMHLECPIVSLDNPDIVCFLVPDYRFIKQEGRKGWMIQVDTRKKELLSVVQCTTDPWKEHFRVPVKLQW